METKALAGERGRYRPLEGERKQVTVLFADLKGSATTMCREMGMGFWLEQAEAGSRALA